MPKSAFYNFFPELNNLKTYCIYFFRASWNFPEQVDIWYHLPDEQVVKKVNFDPCFMCSVRAAMKIRATVPGVHLSYSQVIIIAF